MQKCLVLVGFWLVLSFTARSAEMFGLVSDPSGLPAAGAHVAAIAETTAATYDGTTGDRGDYHLLGLPAGTYSLDIQQRGFRRSKMTGLIVRLDDRLQLNVELEIG